MGTLFDILPHKTISSLVNDIQEGRLGLPDLQRPFVWKDVQVRDFLDSMKRGYPIGSLMLWECPTLTKKKQIGSPEDKNYNTPNEVIIDGQQRLTSLFAIITGKPVKDDHFRDKKISISYNPLTDVFDVASLKSKADAEWIYDISDIFMSDNIYAFVREYTRNLAKYMEKRGEMLTIEMGDLVTDRIMSVYNLTDCDIPVFLIKQEADEESVSEIFVRVNSGGVKLKQNDFILTLLSLYWDDGRRTIEKFCIDSMTYSQEQTSFNQITIVEAQDIIRVAMAYVFDRGRLKYGYKLLRGADFENKGEIDVELRDARFRLLEEKMPDVLNIHDWHEFIKSVMAAGYHSGDLILSRNAIFYSYAMYLIAKHRFHVPDIENQNLTALWFFMASLKSLYVGSFESTVENHLNALKELSTAEEYREFIVKRVREEMTDDFFNITLLGTNGLEVAGRGNNAWCAYVASLIVLGRKVLFATHNIPVAKLCEIGTDGNRKSLEKHHIFPKAYLRSLQYKDSMINQMANYALIDWKDNMEILDGAPADYYKEVRKNFTEEELAEMERENALPHGWENMQYETFLAKRRELMAKVIREAYEELLRKV